MIDKIKIKLENVLIPNEKRKGYFQFPSSKNSKTVVSVKYMALEENKNTEFIQDDFEEDDKLDSYKIIDEHRMKINIVDYRNKETSTLYIEGSIRKWFYGMNSTQDLTKKDFITCIDKLAKEIGINDNSLWNSTVTKLETGVSIKLKEKHRGLVNCIFHYKDFKKHIHGEYGVEFKGVNYDVIFYDQVRKIFNRKGKKEKSHNKISKNNFILRYEIQGHKVSGMLMFKEKLNTLLKIRSNWKYVGTNLLKVLDKTQFVQVISPEAFITVTKGEKTEMAKFLTFKGMQSIGLENFRVILSQMKSKRKSDFRSDFIETYESFAQMDTEDHKAIFTEKVEKRILRLK